MKKLFTKVTLMAVALLMGGVNSAMAVEINETYDFQTWGTAHMNRDTYATLTFAATSDFQIEGKDIYVISSITSAKDGNKWDLPSRIAATTDITIRWGRGSSDQPRLGTENAGTKYISIVNLNVGDQVKFNNASATFVSTNVTYDNAGVPTAVAKDEALQNNVTYTMTAAGHVDIKVTGWGNIRQIYVTRYLSEEEVSAPSMKVTGAKGISRFVTLTAGVSSLGNSVETYYTTDGTTPSASSAKYTTPVEVSRNCTIKAISVSSEGTSSDVSSYNVEAGTTVKLNNPWLVNRSYTKTNNLYYLAYNFASDNSSVIGAPTSTYTYSFNGSAPVAGTSFETTAAGILTVTASADGYESASVDFEVTPLIPEIWYDYTADDYAGPSPALGIRKWSGNDHWSFEAGKGYKAVRLDAGNPKNSWAQINISGIAAFSYNDGEDHLYVIANNNNTGNESLQNVSYGNYLTGVYRFVPVAATRTIGTNGYASFSCDKAVNVPADVTVYTAKVSGDNVVLSPITETAIPANTGVILAGTAGEEVVFTVAAEAAPLANANDLIASSLEPTVPATGTYYALSATEAKFAKVKNGLVLSTNKSYLPASSENASKGLDVVFGEATAADVVVAAPAKAAMANGKYVKNGKLFIVKDGKQYNAVGMEK